MFWGAMERIDITVTGRVQGVGFRWHTVRQATALELAGWVRNQPDGSVRIVVAHEDPGVPNWVNTVGHSQGTMCFRWIRATEHPQPRTRVVKRSELAGASA